MSDNIEKNVISGLWKLCDIVWNNVQKDVNIVVCVNGVGKTPWHIYTLVRLLS